MAMGEDTKLQGLVCTRFRKKSRLTAGRRPNFLSVQYGEPALDLQGNRAQLMFSKMHTSPCNLVSHTCGITSGRWV